MHTSRGSLILKALSPTADEPQLIVYLEKRAKSIPPDKIPTLLRNLPVVLSRNVAEDTGLLVVRRLQELGAEAQFLPLQDGADAALLPGPDGSDDRAESDRIKLPPLRRTSALTRSLRQINRELWIIAAMLAIAWMLNHTIASQYLLLGFYTLPAVVSAYSFGRRQAVFTAFASILLVGLVCHFNPDRFDRFNPAGLGGDSHWYHIASWGCILLVTAYTMGTLYERNKNKMQELRQSYQGLLLILRHFVAQNEERENHCFRVSIYATRIATHLGLEKDEIEDIRSAALLHDLGRMRISRAILDKATRFIRDEPPREDSGGGTADEQLLSGPMGRILPLLIGFQEQAPPPSGEAEETIPQGARILAVADAYDTLTAGGHDRTALSPEEARDTIVAGTGTAFDPEVVHAFTKAFNRLEMELPAVIL
ncbi:HD-GYP domain-containing protein [Desulfobulbus elongatus]|uniref:HD-GYP domain-containing protein n=1 Tax=Desulfobulbus elongatus TaxID=53332 RepID=UPI0004830E26|nr:HD domain-containing phosphohydrolase [Desulfobulbus elongatus]